MVASAFQLHPLHLTLLRLRELCRDYDQAEIDHEERADLQMRTLFNLLPFTMAFHAFVLYVILLLLCYYKNYIILLSCS